MKIEAYEIRDDMTAVIGLMSHLEASTAFLEDENRLACRAVKNNLEYILDKMNRYILQQEERIA